MTVEGEGYTLNLEKYPFLIKKIEEKKDVYAEVLKHALLKKSIEFVEQFIPKNEKMLKLLEKKGYIKGLRRKIELLKQKEEKYFQGIDIDQIQRVVTDIFNFSPENMEFKENNRNAYREEYFKLMREAGFLVTEAKDCHSLKYDVKEKVTTFLEKNPNVDKLILGCGASVSEHSSICHDGLSEGNQLHENGMTLDISAGIRPDIQTDMHNVNFWENIPEARFGKILDHSNGKWVFENKKTLEAIFRSLKKGGSFQGLTGFDEEETELLKKVGFKIIIDGKKITLKK